MTGKQIAAEIRKLPGWNAWSDFVSCVRGLDHMTLFNDDLGSPAPGYLGNSECDHVFAVMSHDRGSDYGIEVLLCLACGHMEDR